MSLRVDIPPARYGLRVASVGDGAELLPDLVAVLRRVHPRACFEVLRSGEPRTVSHQGRRYRLERERLEVTP